MKKRLSLLFITLLTLTHVQAKAFEPRTDIITDKITVIYAGYNGFRFKHLIALSNDHSYEINCTGIRIGVRTKARLSTYPNINKLNFKEIDLASRKDISTISDLSEDQCINLQTMLENASENEPVYININGEDSFSLSQKQQN